MNICHSHNIKQSEKLKSSFHMQYKFLDVVRALQYFFRENNEIVIWFDLFSNNQHLAVKNDFDWWSNTFKSAIESMGRCVVV